MCKNVRGVARKNMFAYIYITQSKLYKYINKFNVNLNIWSNFEHQGVREKAMIRSIPSK